MKNFKLIVAVGFLSAIVGCAPFESSVQTFKPGFTIDETDCGEISFPSSEGSVQFGKSDESCGGRVQPMQIASRNKRRL